MLRFKTKVLAAFLKQYNGIPEIDLEHTIITKDQVQVVNFRSKETDNLFKAYYNGYNLIKANRQAKFIAVEEDLLSGSFNILGKVCNNHTSAKKLIEETPSKDTSKEYHTFITFQSFSFNESKLLSQTKAQ